MKRCLFLLHRWFGIATGLLLAMWFLSGMVMMYVPYPELTAAERLQGLSPIDWARLRSLPGPVSGGKEAVLEESVDGPVWRVPAKGREQVFSAETGLALHGADARAAGRIAADFGHAPVRSVERIERDQWTVAGRFDPDRPLWRVSLDSTDGRALYVASTTGAVVQDTRRAERFWNWLGSVPHWIYLTALRQNQPLWRQVVLWTSGAGIVVAVSGMWIGLLRFRFAKPYSHGRSTPYRGWHRWHHWLGLFGGTLLVTWIVSGWLSVDPNRWFESPGLSDDARGAYARPGALDAIDGARLGARPEAAGAKRMRLVWVQAEPLLVLERAQGSPVVLDARSLGAVRFDADRLVQGARRLVPGARITSAETLSRPDDYWYDARGEVELPVLRVMFDDLPRTWVYLSLRTGEVLEDIDARRRLYRWLYSGLHCWDFGALVTRRPLWDLWMWAWLLAGFALATTGTVIGYRRLRLRAASHRSRRMHESDFGDR